MKRVLLAGLLVLGVGRAWAYEIPENPDRKPSIGINFDRHDLKGDYEYLTIKLPEAGTLVQNNFRGDLRLPMATWLTFSIGGGYMTQDLGLAVINKDERWKMKGYSLTAGFRLYIP